MSRTSIEGKKILITGGAKDLGGLVSRDLAERGAKGIAIHHHGDSSREDAEALYLQDGGFRGMIACNARNPGSIC